MHFGILGPLRVTDSGRPVAITAGRDRIVLAMLLLRPGQIVAADELIDAVWDDDPPATARGQLQTCVSRLRRALPADAIRTDPAGYGIRVTADNLDSLAFAKLVAQARTSEATAGKILREALALWRGAALAGIESRAVRQQATVLDEQHATIIEDWLEQELAGGQDRDLVPELSGLVEQFPLRERLRAQLMLALHRAGRQADALAEYRRAHDLFRDQLGLEPGAVLQDLHRRILVGEEGAPQRPGAGVVVDGLPRAVGDFTGRAELMARLLETMDDAEPVPAIRVIDGMAGSGKTTAAVHLAGLVQDRFPDARLFIDLQGHGDQRPLTPEAALVALLRQLGVRAEHIPADADERIRLWRSELVTRRAIVVLDNAASTAQVLPLLPASGVALVLITSRRRLAGLDGVHPESLPVLDDAEAVALLEKIVGDRVTAEPAAALAVVRRCGRLPLAIRLAGARLAHRPRWRVADLLRRLSESALPELAAEDRTVASAFALSYGQLPGRAQRMFRLLGLHPGERFEALAVAALTDETLDEARDLLDDLLDVHLVEEPEPEVFRLHDLLREYAAVLAAELPADVRRDAVTKLLDFQLYAILETNDGQHHALARRDLGVSEPRRPDLAAALADPAAHLERERRNLAAFVDAARAADRPQYAWRLPRAAWRYLYVRGYVQETDVLLRQALDAARRIGDESAAASCANYLASAAHRLGYLDEARRLLEGAIRIRRDMGDDRSVARYIVNLSIIYESEGRFTEMIELSTEALRISQRFPDELMTTANSRTSIGNANAKLGRYGPALYHTRLRLMRAIELQDVIGTAAALHHIGQAKWKAGLAGPAVIRRLTTTALRLNRCAGFATGESENLGDLALLEHSEGNTSTALVLVREAVTIAERVGHRGYQALFRGHLGEFLLSVGDVAGARASCDEAVRLSRQRLPYEWALSLSRRAAVHLAEQEVTAARQLWEQALTLLNGMGAIERHDVERSLAALDSGVDQLQAPTGGGRMEA